MEYKIKGALANSLTQRQKICLIYAAKGMTSVETANTLGLKTSTVESHRKEIKRKLSCVTMAQAVYEGIRLGHLTVDA
jgi:DNA-binding CsgD family transcriptional regulator